MLENQAGSYVDLYAAFNVVKTRRAISRFTSVMLTTIHCPKVIVHAVKVRGLKFGAMIVDTRSENDGELGGRTGMVVDH